MLTFIDGHFHYKTLCFHVILIHFDNLNIPIYVKNI